jgi:hypothetical protein
MLFASFWLSGCGGSRSNRNAELFKDDPVVARKTEPAKAIKPSAGASKVEPEQIFFPKDFNPDALYGPDVRSVPATRIPDVAPRTHAVEPIRGEAEWNVPLGRTWRWIVVHHSATERGNAEIFGNAHKRRGWLGLGYHFVIGNGTDSGDGQIETGFRWTRQLHGAHTGDEPTNQQGIGICLVGDFDGSRPTARQTASLKRLVSYLQARTGVPMNYVIGHREIDPKHTVCPGKYFDLDGFRRSLGSAGGVGEQSYGQMARSQNNVRGRMILVREDGAGVP